MSKVTNECQAASAKSCNALCDAYECPKNAGGVCRAPNQCLGYEEAGKVMAELEAAKRELAKARAALSAPPLNCEVGTAEEQQARHCEWCRKHGIDGDNTVNCLHPDLSCDLCALRWSQMPYEAEQEGGNDGSK